MAEEKNISLDIDVPDSTTIFADTNAYTTIIRNLIDNAIKYTPNGGIINMSAQQTKEGVSLKVTDSGIGIAPQELNQLFDLVKNKSKKGTSGEMGSGLGLSLVSELVKLNKGTLNVISQLKKGTTFEVILPSTI